MKAGLLKAIFLSGILFNMSFSSSLIATSNKFKVTYISPVPGSIRNLPHTNIIIKTNEQIDLKSPINFIVFGEKSGLHSCNKIIGDDGKTLIFKPYNEFSEFESVKVYLRTKLKSISGEFIDSLSFSFSTSKQFSVYINKEWLTEESNIPEVNSSINKTIVLPAGDSIPADFPKFKITVNNHPDSDYIFISTTSARKPYLMILDNNCSPVYYKRTESGTYDFKVQPNGWLTWYDMKSSCYFAIDSSYNLVDSFRCGNGYNTDIHELRILPNDHALILGYDIQKFDMSQAGGSDSADVVGSIIQELDKNKNVIFQWLSWDHFQISDTYNDVSYQTFDFSHANSIDVDMDGNLLVSFRNLQEVTKINWSTGEIIWRLGGKNNQFQFLNEPYKFSWQHAARRLPNGNIILFDNGTKRDFKITFARAVEYKIDEAIKTAKLVWEFRNVPDIYSNGLGYAQRLKNGNTLICWGAAVPSVTEVRPNGTKAFEMSIDENIYTYRAYRFPWKYGSKSPGKLIFSNSFFEFITTDVNDTSSVKLIIKNNSGKAVTIRSLKNSSSVFYTLFDVPHSVMGNESLSMTIFFKPTHKGYFIDTLEVAHDGGLEKIILRGNTVSSGIQAYQFNPDKYFLYQNFPNPFNLTTEIRYEIPEQTIVNLSVVNILGQVIKIIVNEEQIKGFHSINWNGTDNSGVPVGSGIFILRMQAGGFIFTEKVVLIK